MSLRRAAIQSERSPKDKSMSSFVCPFLGPIYITVSRGHGQRQSLLCCRRLGDSFPLPYAQLVNQRFVRE